jgi:pimeloyl-ACP methyl ester carboxylesterase
LIKTNIDICVIFVSLIEDNYQCVTVQENEESQEKGYQHMKPKTSFKNQSTATAREHYTTGSVTSQDGTTIGYRQLGHGPGVLLLHGAASSAHNHMQLAEALADAFTVYVPDRRGRGLSGPYSEDYSIQKDVEDLDALLTKTGTHQVFGVSSGGIICLQAALALPTIHKAAIYEPPFFINDESMPTTVLARYDKEMAQGRVAAALITGMKGAQMGPPIFNVMPRWLLELLVSMAMKGEDKKGSDGYVSMRALAPTLHYDFQLVVEMSVKLESFRAIRAEVLLLGGSKSPAFLKVALDALEKVLPHVKRVEFPGLGHAASWNYDKQRNPSGKPEVVAQELRRFFAEP